MCRLVQDRLGRARRCIHINMAKSIVSVLKNNLPKLRQTFQRLERVDVLVGVPQETDTREGGGAMNNATLAYIHDNGSPAQNIPARPFMKPGIEAAKDKIAIFMGDAAKKTLALQSNDADLSKAGMAASSAIKTAINEGIPPPLKPGTLRARIRAGTSVKGAKAELAARAAGDDEGIANAKPLIATGQMRNSITYVLRRK